MDSVKRLRNFEPLAITTVPSCCFPTRSIATPPAYRTVVRMHATITTVGVMIVALWSAERAVASTRDERTVCERFRSQWRTTYAPDSLTDVNWNAPRAVSPGATPDTCAPGVVPDEPFVGDALRRLNHYRWLSGLPNATIDAGNQRASQRCALMMAMNLNRDSPYAHATTDPHTDHEGWQCAPADAREAARYGNVYAGQSYPSLGYLWQTTPARIVHGFVDDYSSSKVGHRQNVLCPHLDDVSLGHACFFDPVTERHFCGGCQWAYGRRAGAPRLASDFYVAWPPDGPIARELLPQHPMFYWSVAAFAPRSSASELRVAVRINGVDARAQLVAGLCLARDVAPRTGDELRWARFRAPSYELGDELRVDVEWRMAAGAAARTWSYTVRPIDCETVTSVPTRTPTERPTRAPTERPTRAPTERPTRVPTDRPTPAPTPPPTRAPTERPTRVPTRRPTLSPTAQPTRAPTARPTRVPTRHPTRAPTPSPTTRPTLAPSLRPTAAPTRQPTNTPTRRPTTSPTPKPTPSPTLRPSAAPSVQPTNGPRSMAPTPAPPTRTVPPGPQPTLAPTPPPTPPSDAHLGRLYEGYGLGWATAAVVVCLVVFAWCLCRTTYAQYYAAHSAAGAHDNNADGTAMRALFGPRPLGPTNASRAMSYPPHAVDEPYVSIWVPMRNLGSALDQVRTSQSPWPSAQQDGGACVQYHHSVPWRTTTTGAVPNTSHPEHVAPTHRSHEPHRGRDRVRSNSRRGRRVSPRSTSPPPPPLPRETTSPNVRAFSS